MASPFRPVQDALHSAADGIADEAASMPQVGDQSGLVAEALGEDFRRWQVGLEHQADHMRENADGPVEQMAAADEELTRHPSQHDVDAQKKRVMQVKALLIANPGSSPAILKHEQSTFDQMKSERDAAKDAHTAGIVSMTDVPDDTVIGRGQSGYQSNTGAVVGGLNGGGPGGGSGGSSGGWGGGGSTGGSSTGSESPVGNTHLSGDPSPLTGQPQSGGAGQPQMPQMGQVQGAQPGSGASPMGGGMPSALGGPGATLPKYGRDKKKDDGIPDYSPVLSGSDGNSGSGIGAVPVDRGTSLRDLKSLSDTSGVNKPSVGVTGTPPGGGAGGQAGMARGGMMGGGGMGSGAGMGASAKAKEKPDIKSAVPEQHGFESYVNSVEGGTLSRETAEAPTVEDDLGLTPLVDNDKK